MAAEMGTKRFLRGLAEKLIQADLHSLSKKVVKSAFNKALTCLPVLYHSEVMNHKDLYADLLQGYVEEIMSEKSQFDLPYNLYLSNNHRKIDRMMRCDLWEEKDILIRNLLQKKFSSVSVTDILQIMYVTGNSQNQGKSTKLLEDIYILNTISARLTDIKSLLKFMSVCCRMFMLSSTKSIDMTIRLQMEMDTLLIIFKTRFAGLENVSEEETADYYDYLAAFCCIYVELVAKLNNKPATGNKLSEYMCYVLKNSLQYQLDMLLQIDKHLNNENIMVPLISKIFEPNWKYLSCEMYLRYILAARHVCVPQRYSHSRSKIKRIRKKCLNLQTPSTFYMWLTTHLPYLEEHLDKDDEMAKFLMTCPENVVKSLIILLSRKPKSEHDIIDVETADTKTGYSSNKRKLSREPKSENQIEQDVIGENADTENGYPSKKRKLSREPKSENQIEQDVIDGENADTENEYPSNKRKLQTYILISEDDNDLPLKQTKYILGN